MNRRPIYVDQRENRKGDFWYAVRGANGETVLTSKMYGERWRAVRAARAFITSIAPAPVVLSYRSGPTPASVKAGTSRGQLIQHTERVRC